MFLLLPLSVSAIKEKERQTLGIRGSAEVVRTAVLTFGVSLLIRFWLAGCLSRLRHQHSNLTFISYLYHMDRNRAVEKHRDVKMTAGQWRTAIGLAVVAAYRLVNVMITVRIPSVVEQVGHGTAQTAGLF